MSNYLTNSRFVSGLDCLKKLYLYSHSERIQLISEETLDFKRLFQSIVYPNGIDLSGLSTNERIDCTADELKKDRKILYNGLFQNSKYGFSDCDILQLQNGKINCVFITPATEFKDTMFYECAYSIFIIGSLNYRIGSVKVAYVNKAYVRSEGDITSNKEFWKIIDITDATLKFQKQIERKVNAQILVLSEKSEPQVEIAHHCFKPRLCQFKEKCWGSLPENHIFKMKSMHLGTKLGYFYRGIESMEQLVEKNLNFKDNQKIQLRCSINKEIAIDYEGLKEWLKPALAYRSINFLDFETIAPIVPVYTGATPYTKIPFQFSLHKLDLTTGSLSHKEYLADPIQRLDSRSEFLNALLKAFEDSVDRSKIIVYNKTFENSILKILSVDFPEHSDRIRNLQDRLYDLMEVFSGFNSKTIYYDPRFGNSYSLKTILPVLTKETYDHLEIKDGLTASVHYFNVLYSGVHFRKQIRNNLLKYCYQDTYATVKIFQFLLNLQNGEFNISNNTKTYENEHISKRVSSRTANKVRRLAN